MQLIVDCYHRFFKYDKIPPIQKLPPELITEIFSRTISPFTLGYGTQNDLPIFRLFPLVSKKFHILIEPAWTAIKRKNGWCISWNLSHIRPENRIFLEYMRTKDLLNLGYFIFGLNPLDFDKLPKYCPFIDSFKNRENLLRVNRRLVEPKMKTGEKLLKLFIDYRNKKLQTPKIEDQIFLDFLQGITNILEKDWEAFPFIFCILYTSMDLKNTTSNPPVMTLVEKSIHLWRNDDKYPLEKGIKLLVKNNLCPSIENIAWFEKLYSKPENQVPPVLLTLIKYRLEHLLTHRFPEKKLASETLKFKDTFNSLHRAYLPSIIKFLAKRYFSLEYIIVIELLLPELEKINHSTFIFFLQALVMLKNGNLQSAYALFLDYLKRSQTEELTKKNQYKLRHLSEIAFLRYFPENANLSEKFMSSCELFLKGIRLDPTNLTSEFRGKKILFKAEDLCEAHKIIFRKYGTVYGSKLPDELAQLMRPLIITEKALPRKGLQTQYIFTRL